MTLGLVVTLAAPARAERGTPTRVAWSLASGLATAILPVVITTPLFATAGSDAKCAACMALGAEQAFNYRTTDWVKGVRDATLDQGVDMVLDMVGGDYVARNLDALAVEGRLVQIAFLKSSRVEIDLMQVMRRRLTITGSTLRPRSPEEKGAIARQLAEHVWPLIESGAVKPVIHATFPLERASEAHRVMEESRHIGKLILTTG